MPNDIAAPTPTPTSWAPEVIADSGGKWSRNSLRFATQEEAYASAQALAMRWMLVTDWRAAPADEPVCARFDKEHGTLTLGKWNAERGCLVLDEPKAQAA